MSFDFQRSKLIFRRYQGNILKEYQDAWDALKDSEYIDNKSIIRSCEQKIIKLGKIELQHSLQQLCNKLNVWLSFFFDEEITEMYKSCVLLHLINVFCIPGQEEKMRVVQVELNKVMHTMTEEDRCDAIESYLSQRLKVKSSLTEIDFLTSQIDPHHEFLLKLCYWDIFCAKRTDEGCKEFIPKKIDYLVLNIKREVRSIPSKFLWDENDGDEIYKEFLRRNADLFVSQIEEVIHGKNTKTKYISCKILLCLLNWNICTLKPTFIQSEINSDLLESCSLQSEERNTTKELCTMYQVRCVLQDLLSTLTDNETSEVFNDYIDQMYTIKSEITPDGLCIGETGSNHEYQLKLCYWRTICRKNDNKAYKKFIQLYPEFLVSYIKKRTVLTQGTKTKRFFCKTLLCILNWNICALKTAPHLVQKSEIQASSSGVIIADSSPKYSCTAETVNSILQTLLSTLSEEEIFTTFNNYLDILYAMKSEITEDDFCTGEIEPYHEFQLKLCHYEKLCNKNDETSKEFLKRNSDFLLPQIEALVDNKSTKTFLPPQIEALVDNKSTKTKLISCKVLLCISKWEICSSKTAYTLRNNIPNQMLKELCQDILDKHVLFFVSMVHTAIKRNNMPVLIILCDVLFCISYNKYHFQDVTGAINKLIRYYATQVGIDERICEWINLFGHMYTKHTQDIHNHTAAEEIHYDFQMLKNFLSDLFAKAIHVGTNFDLLINAFRKEISLYGNYGILYNKLWRAKLTCKVKIIQISKNIRKKTKNLPFEIDENKNCVEFDFAKLSFIDTFEKEVKEDQLKVKTLQDQINAILIIDEMVKKFQLSEMLVLLLMLLIAGTSNGHHKSAKLKKYLTLKYEYDKASLYLLWCSGDIEVHPGPSLNKKSLVHDSSIERRWIKNISPKIVVLLPKHEQSKYKPTKKVRNDSENREHFKLILKTCQEEQVHVPKMYLAEINAWETKEYQLLNKQFVYRYEVEKIITSLQDFLTCGGCTSELSAINISFDTELQTNKITMILGKDQRPIDKSQLMVYITRHIAGISIKCAYEKDPDAKCDGLWDSPLENWPKDIILFDPNNRGKYSKKYRGKKLICDQELVDNLITLPQVTIPQKYTKIVDAYKLMRKSKTKHNKAELCSIFKRTTSLEKLDYALKNLSENGIFTEEVHDILTKWWTTGVVEAGDNQTQSLENMDDAKKIERPHVLIYLHTKSFTFTVKPTSPNSSQVSYNFPFKDELVPLKTMKLSTTPEDNPGDNQTDSFIIPQATMNILNSIITFDPNTQAIFESEIKLQCKTSTQDTASSSMTHLNQTTSSSFQFRQLNHNIAISGQPVPILFTHNQSTTNLDDLGHLHLSSTKDSKNLAFQNLVSPTSDIGLSDSTSSVNSEGGNEERDQNNTLNKGQDLLTDSDYSSDSSNNCVSKTSMKKRKCIEEDRIEMKKRKIPSLKEDKKQSETTIHRKIDSLMDNSTPSNKDMELLLDYLDIDLDSFNIDDQTFEVEMNALDNEDKNLEICDKDGNLMNAETQISNKNTNVSAYDTNVSSDLEMFLHEMIYGESEKMIQMKSYLPDV